MKSVKRRRLSILATIVGVQVLSASPVALAEPGKEMMQEPSAQHLEVDTNSFSILGTLVDIFSCEHNPGLPWC